MSASSSTMSSSGFDDSAVSGGGGHEGRVFDPENVVSIIPQFLLMYLLAFL